MISEPPNTSMNIVAGLADLIFHVNVKVSAPNDTSASSNTVPEVEEQIVMSAVEVRRPVLEVAALSSAACAQH